MEQRKARGFKEEDYILNQVQPESQEIKLPVPRLPGLRGLRSFSRPNSSPCLSPASSIGSGRHCPDSRSSLSPGAKPKCAGRLRMGVETNELRVLETDEFPLPGCDLPMRRPLPHAVETDTISLSPSVARSQSSKKFAVWLSVNAKTGDVGLYPRAAASRLEEAHHHRRTNVPLAGLGGKFEDAIVHIGQTDDGQSIQQTLEGRCDVKRIEVSAACTEITIDMSWNGVWHIADLAVPGVTEARSVLISDVDMVSPPLPVDLPQGNRRMFYNSDSP